MSAWLAFSSHCETDFVQQPTDLTKLVTMGAPLKFLRLITALSLTLENLKRGFNAFRGVKSNFGSTTSGQPYFRILGFVDLGGGIFFIGRSRPSSWWFVFGGVVPVL